MSLEKSCFKKVTHHSSEWLPYLGGVGVTYLKYGTLPAIEHDPSFLFTIGSSLILGLNSTNFGDYL